ncbi:uncharacterized protein [Physcomitrium patens]|uniref:uncharacterized protein n=1 Tax=Physcomitrium patens TaxID=3218 RepID=UPI003CCD1C44
MDLWAPLRRCSSHRTAIPSLSPPPRHRPWQSCLRRLLPRQSCPPVNVLRSQRKHRTATAPTTSPPLPLCLLSPAVDVLCWTQSANCLSPARASSMTSVYHATAAGASPSVRVDGARQRRAELHDRSLWNLLECWPIDVPITGSDVREMGLTRPNDSDDRYGCNHGTLSHARKQLDKFWNL